MERRAERVVSAWRVDCAAAKVSLNVSPFLHLISSPIHFTRIADQCTFDESCDAAPPGDESVEKKDAESMLASKPAPSARDLLLRAYVRSLLRENALDDF